MAQYQFKVKGMMLKMDKYKLVILIGKSGSGKDTILEEVLKHKDFNPVVSMTTRPPREDEIDGKDYIFVDSDTFTKYLLEDKLIEATIFNNWAYGTPYSSLSFEKTNIAVLNPEGVRILKEDNKLNVTVIYINASDKTRLIRQLQREENPNIQEILRRYGADEKDFEPSKIKPLVDYTLDNETKEDLQHIVSLIAGDKYD